MAGGANTFVPMFALLPQIRKRVACINAPTRLPLPDLKCKLERLDKRRISLDYS